MHPRFHAAFALLAQPLQTALQPLMTDLHFPAMLTADQVDKLKQQTQLDDHRLAISLLPLAAACALVPLSNFNVGAIAHGVSGNLYFGCNMEFLNTTMQHTVHAEQSAITHAWMRGEKALTAITVNYTPCGHCRQFMNELNSAQALEIHIPGRAVATLKEYLPDAFGPRDLNITTLLLDEVHHGFRLHGDLLTQAAISAANRSHAPYSKAAAGVALETQDGTIFNGSYVENAAFNPTLGPLQTALNLLNLSGYEYGDIQRAILAEHADALLSQWDTTFNTLHVSGIKNIDRIFIEK